jgi:hypothetical protein
MIDSTPRFFRGNVIQCHCLLSFCNISGSASRLLHIDIPGNKALRCLSVTCPSTAHNYVLRVGNIFTLGIETLSVAFRNRSAMPLLVIL